MYLRTISALLAVASILLSPVASSDVCTPAGTTFGSGGGRKIAIVIDSSSSNLDTDPNNLRIAAAKAFNDRLTTMAEAGKDGHGLPDLVTIVDFDDSSKVVYPLGDPSGANFSSIDSYGGTYIAGGVHTAILELTKDTSSPIANHTGIVVLTDGQDSSISLLVAQLNNATALGIRVSFGFLQTPGSPVDPPADLVTAILATGGIYSNIDSAIAQANFVNLIVSHGPTGVDASTSTSGDIPLFAGLSVAHLVGSTGEENTFTYSAVSGEKLNFTVQSLSQQSLRATLDSETAETNDKGFASIVMTAAKDENLKLVVRVLNGTQGGVYTVGLNSSLSVCTPPKTNGTATNGTATNGTATNGTATDGTNTTIPPFTPSPSESSLYGDGAAGLLPQGFFTAAVITAMFLVAF